MTELTQHEPDETPSRACLQCGNPDVVQGYRNNLCADCRHYFIHYPVPKWVWLFAGGIGALLLFSFLTLPRNLSLGMDLEKGKKAIQEHKYLTAQRDLEAFTSAVPKSEEGNAYLMIASFNNLDFESLATAYHRLENKKIEDEDLYNKITSLTTKLDSYTPSDSLDSFYAHYKPEDTLAMFAGLKAYTVQHPGELYAKAVYGTHLMDEQQYLSADSVYTILLQQQADYIPALSAMTTLKRLEDKPREAVLYSDKLIAINKENVYALSTKARSLLRENKNEEALKTAQAAALLKPGDQYNTATLALVYHFSKMEKEKQKIVQAMKEDKDSAALSYYQFAFDVMDNKQTFR